MPKKNRGFFLEWRKERKLWEIVWYEHGKRRRKSTGAADRDEADDALKIHKERAKKRETSRLVDDVLTDYLNEHAKHTAKFIDIANCVVNLSPLYELTVDEVTKGKCQGFAVLRREQAFNIGKTISDGTIRKDLEILRAAFNHDFKEGRIEKVPYIWMPPKPEARDRWLTRNEIAALLRAARRQTRHLPWFILLSLYSGQRKAAVLNLTWDRVDMINGVINWQYGQSTNKRRPKQPMTDEVKMFLRYLRPYGTQGFVISNDGARVGDIKRSLRTALKAAGIKGASAHTLKHTALTWMLQNGTDIYAVAGFTGTSAQTLLSTYGHHSPNYLEAARTSHKQARNRRRLPSIQPHEKAA